MHAHLPVPPRHTVQLLVRGGVVALTAGTERRRNAREVHSGGNRKHADPTPDHIEAAGNLRREARSAAARSLIRKRSIAKDAARVEHR